MKVTHYKLADGRVLTVRGSLELPARLQLRALVDQGFDQSYLYGRDESGRFTRAVRVKCSQCTACTINGIPCHETGCPHQTRECDECGSTIPIRQRLCESCANPEIAEDYYHA